MPTHDEIGKVFMWRGREEVNVREKVRERERGSESDQCCGEVERAGGRGEEVEV